jgi:SAM-dependent methyltransferase
VRPIPSIIERSPPQVLSAPIEIGDLPRASDAEFAEFQKYESGSAEQDAQTVAGPYREPWLNVLRAFEPGTPPALEQLLTHETLGSLVIGRVLDLGAGTGWATARLSRETRVAEVTALDLSPGFLDRVTRRVVGCLDCRPEKIRLVASDFRRIPRPDQSYDAAFLIAALHHSLAPILLLREVRRVLKPGGYLFVLENPALWFQIRRKRRQALGEWLRSGATEITYTRGEFEYLLRCGGFTQISTLLTRSPEESPHRLRRALRRAARAFGIEQYLSPPTLFFIATDPISSPSPGS